MIKAVPGLIMFKLENYVYLSSNEVDELYPSLSHLERSYGMYKHRNILLQFPKEFNNNNILDNNQIKITLKEFGLGTGTLVFEFINLKNKNYTFNYSNIL
jgi:hypothetical protein